MKRVLVDTGPLVAILSSTDDAHEKCIAALREMPGPLFTCWAVITEAAWLLRRSEAAVRFLVADLERGPVQLLPLGGNEGRMIASIMKKYEHLRPQLADASLVYLAHRERLDTIFTLDRRDFSVYRDARGKPFRIVP